MVAITDAASDAAAAIQSAGTIIIKIGSSLLVEDAHGAVNAAWLAGVAGDIAMLREAGKNVVVVSSGAIALGRRELGINNRELALEEKQAAAATGQVTLDGRTSTFSVLPYDTVLTAIQRSRPEVPFACQAGVCSTCRARVTEGEVEMATTYGLVPGEADAGFILTCQATPASGTVSVDFDV